MSAHIDISDIDIGNIVVCRHRDAVSAECEHCIGYGLVSSIEETFCECGTEAKPFIHRHREEEGINADIDIEIIYHIHIHSHSAPDNKSSTSETFPFLCPFLYLHEIEEVI